MPRAKAVGAGELLRAELLELLRGRRAIADQFARIGDGGAYGARLARRIADVEAGRPVVVSAFDAASAMWNAGATGHEVRAVEQQGGDVVVDEQGRIERVSALA